MRLVSLVMLWVAAVCGATFDFPEYALGEARLSGGPHLLLDEYAFAREPLGAAREVTVECWLYLRDWYALHRSPRAILRLTVASGRDDEASLVSRPFFAADDASAADAFPSHQFVLGYA